MTRSQPFNPIVCILTCIWLASCEQPSVTTAPAKNSASVPVPNSASLPTLSNQTTVKKSGSTADATGYKSQFHRAEDLLADGNLEGTLVAIGELDTVAAKLSPNEMNRLADLKERLEEKQQLHEDEVRQSLLAQAKTAAENGKFDEAMASLQTLLAAAPTTEQSDQAEVIQRQVSRARTLQTRLKKGMELLASADRANVDVAQELLWEEQDAALPLLLDALQSDNAVIATNSLQLLQRFPHPDQTLPAMLGILNRESQATLWPLVIKELQKSRLTGSSAALLQLALAAPSPGRAAMLFDAVAGTSDPPAETLILLLPKLFEDSPVLAQILSAAFQAISVHEQQNVLTHRGLEAELTADQEQQLNALPDRLLAIIGMKETAAQREAAWAAQRLAIAMRVMVPQTFSDVKVLRASSESLDSPATAILDKTWNSVDLKSMWRHPAKRYTTVVLDLGSERTVTGIRVWNCNEANGTHRGWKDVELFVSSDSSPTVPVAQGVIPQAPGAANTPDFGAILPVPFARGRYVKLQMLSVWRDDGTAGLSEVQVLGY